MNGAQKVIKGFAIALAVVIICSIVSAAFGVLSFMGMVVWSGEVERPGDMGVVWEEETSRSVKRLEIATGATKLHFFEVDEGETVRVETDSQYISSWQDNETLHVVEKSHGFFGWGTGGEVQIYVRKGTKFDEVKIDTGAGTMNIEVLSTRKLELELGAGKTYIGALNVSEEAKIDGGAGVIEVRDGEIHDLNLKIGAGKATVRLGLIGNNKIDTGVGKLDLDLIGDKDDYKITVDKGIGKVEIDGNELADSSVYGQGENLVRLESGVGAVDVRMVER